MAEPRRRNKGAAAALIVLLSAALSGPGRAQDAAPDDFQFFQKEAQVVTASRQPSTLAQAPSTVYVVTSEQIRESGAQTLWDVLRAVPGVDVMNERAGQGDVAIRGFNTSFNNNVQVLLDGKTVLNGLFDGVEWEAIPVALEEIDRIEVVEGPASALYGPNAISGVINIITKTPEQLKGGVVSYTGGERDTQMGTALIGDKIGAQSYKLDMGWRSTDMFSDDRAQAESVGKARAFYGLDLPDGAKWSVEGGVSDQDIFVNIGPSLDKGDSGFLRSDFKHDGTTARLFWNWDSEQFNFLPDIPFVLHADTYDLNLEQALDLPFNNALTVGTSYRNNEASSNVFTPGWREQTIFSGFFEDAWRPIDHWSVAVSGREDHDTLTGWQFSPRGSVIYAPNDVHSFRFTSAQAYSEPALFDQYINFTIPNGSVPVAILPNTSLQSEKVQFGEVAYRGNFDWIKTSATGFYYRVTDIVQSRESLDLAPLQITDTPINDGETKAFGGELAAELPLSPQLSSFANYSYQSLIDQNVAQTTARSAPRHKVNAGASYKQNGWTASASADWVDKTFWSVGTGLYAEVPSYLMLNVRVAYAFSGCWQGLEAAVSGFNVADPHFETLPRQSPNLSGENAEIISSRWSGTLSYRFGL